MGEVKTIDEKAAEIQIKPWDVDLYSGKAPTIGTGGSWFTALTPVTDPDAIALVFGLKTSGTEVKEDPIVPLDRYTLDDAASELFMERAEIAKALEQLQRRKNIILQGPPGVGKSFAAHRFA